MMRWLALLVALALPPSLPAAPPAASGDKPAPIRLGFSSQVLVELNETDARAALKIWAQTLGEQVDIPVGPVIIYPNLTAISTALHERSVDAISLTVPEYWTLQKKHAFGPFLVGQVHGELTEQYLLLVHRDHPARQLADLRGQRINVQQGSHASLSKIWEETLLLENRLGHAENFWSRIIYSNKITGVIIPVFFRQTDACIVTREGFRTMSELNPQVGKQLRILAESPALLTNVFVFSAEVDPRHPAKIIAEGTRIADSATGRQILALFQSDKLVLGQPSDLQSAFTLLEQHERLLAAEPTAPGPAPP